MVKETANTDHKVDIRQDETDSGVKYRKTNTTHKTTLHKEDISREATAKTLKRDTRITIKVDHLNTRKGIKEDQTTEMTTGTTTEIIRTITHHEVTRDRRVKNGFNGTNLRTMEDSTTDNPLTEISGKDKTTVHHRVTATGLVSTTAMDSKALETITMDTEHPTISGDNNETAHENPRIVTREDSGHEEVLSNHQDKAGNRASRHRPDSRRDHPV